MNMTKMIYPLAFALAITLASTGCHNRQVKVTKIPSPGQTGLKDPYANPTIPPAPTYNPETDPTKSQIATTDSTMFDNMIEDRAALAAYTIYFAFDSAAIKSSEQLNLESVVAALKLDASTKLLIEGNCDERGTEEYNRSLGERRALAAREALAKHGIDPSRIRTISFGKDKPADTGHDEAAWSKNRRDDFILLHPKAGV